MFRKIENLMAYQRELGWRGCADFVFHRLAHSAVMKIKPRQLPFRVLCRRKDSDFWVLRQIFGREEPMVEFRDEPLFIVDAGANVGYSSLLYASRYPGATIVALEPDAGNCEILRRNCQPFPQIAVLEAAVWPVERELKILNSGTQSFGLRVGPSDSPHEGTVRGMSVPRILEEFGRDAIDLLKMDIEGAEYEVFKSNNEWLKQVRVLLVEPHDRFRPGATDAIIAAVSRLPHSRSQCGEYLMFDFRGDSH